MLTTTKATVLCTLLTTSFSRAFAPPSAGIVGTRKRVTSILPQNVFGKPSVSLMLANQDDDEASIYPLSTTKLENQSKLSKQPDDNNSGRGNNPSPVFVQWVQQAMSKLPETESMSKTAIASAAMAMALLFIPMPSDAAMSGGRMGGSFSSSPSMSRPAPSSYRGSGGGYYGGGSRTTYISRPRVAVAPGLGYGYSPFYSPPVVYGGAGVMSYSRGPSFFDLIFFGGFMFVLLNILSNAGSAVSTGASTSNFFDMADTSSSVLGPGTSVMTMSVALDVANRDDSNSILGVLERIARTAKTDSRVGVQNLTSQVALELLRRKSSIVSASSSYRHFRDQKKAQQEYQARSVQERSKFEKEMVSKYGGVDYGNAASQRAVENGSKATMAVVTLVVAIDGDSTKIPTRIGSITEVEEALRKIAADSKVGDCLQSAEILWTPEDRAETLTFREVVADYPELRLL